MPDWATAAMIPEPRGAEGWEVGRTLIPSSLIATQAYS